MFFSINFEFLDLQWFIPEWAGRQAKVWVFESRVGSSQWRQIWRRTDRVVGRERDSGIAERSYRELDSRDNPNDISLLACKNPFFLYFLFQSHNQNMEFLLCIFVVAYKNHNRNSDYQLSLKIYLTCLGFALFVTFFIKIFLQI